MENLEIIKAKIFNKESLKRELAIWRFKNKKIVFTNGCFDILHLGHIDYLSKAKDFGDVLVIGLNTDNSV
ncbi:MAG: adenylyltransferase/cytidyltransferase family protein, partial [Bacteroidales bacterium]|nr:adenylyltransferase/cytidyltransferase family protein [Bacteroidales bacterium]